MMVYRQRILPVAGMAFAFALTLFIFTFDYRTMRFRATSE
jgi:hypothetical protein